MCWMWWRQDIWVNFLLGKKHCQSKLNLLSPRSPNTGQLMTTSERTFPPVHSSLALGRCRCWKAVLPPMRRQSVGAPAFFADDGIQRPSVCNSLGQCNDKNLTKPLTAWAWSQFCTGIWTGRSLFSPTPEVYQPPLRAAPRRDLRKRLFPWLYSVLVLCQLFLWGQTEFHQWDCELLEDMHYVWFSKEASPQ